MVGCTQTFLTEMAWCTQVFLENMVRLHTDFLIEKVWCTQFILAKMVGCTQIFLRRWCGARKLFLQTWCDAHRVSYKYGVVHTDFSYRDVGLRAHVFLTETVWCTQICLTKNGGLHTDFSRIRTFFYIQDMFCRCTCAKHALYMCT